MRRIIGFLCVLSFGLLGNTALFAEDKPLIESEVPATAPLAESEPAGTVVEESAANTDAGTEAVNETATTAAPLAEGSVSRSMFTNSVTNHEPSDEISSLANDVNSVLFFTELRGLQDQVVLHRWEFGGEIIAEVPFSVGGPRWRVWSSKSLLPDWLGTWTVSVVNGSGAVIDSATLDYQAAAVEPAAASEPVTEEPAVNETTEQAPQASMEPSAESPATSLAAE